MVAGRGREWRVQFACVKTSVFDPVLFLLRGERWAPNPRRSPARSLGSLAANGGALDHLRCLATQPENSRPASGEDRSQRNGNRHSKRFKIWRKSNKLNTPGRESFSDKPRSMWFIVGRKRLPTASADSIKEYLAGCLVPHWNWSTDGRIPMRRFRSSPCLLISCELVLIVDHVDFRSD